MQTLKIKYDNYSNSTLITLKVMLHNYVVDITFAVNRKLIQS